MNLDAFGHILHYSLFVIPIAWLVVQFVPRKRTTFFTSTILLLFILFHVTPCILLTDHQPTAHANGGFTHPCCVQQSSDAPHPVEIATNQHIIYQPLSLEATFYTFENTSPINNKSPPVLS